MTQRKTPWIFLPLAAAFLLPLPATAGKDAFEVWVVDQSDSFGKTYGGTLHIYDGRDLTKKNPSASTPTDVIDLGAAVASLCLQATGVNPVRPHMLVFNNADTHAALSFVASGHVVFFHAPTRTPVACFRTEAGAGGARQAHAIWPSTDDQYLLVANQNGKKYERIRTEYAANIFTQEPQATVDLANCTTPNGFACQDPLLRPDNAPICPFTASDNGPAFASLRGGGMFVIDWQQTPMAIVAEYDMAQIPGNGCGLIEARTWVYFNSGGGSAANLDQFTVMRLPMTGYSATNPPNTPAVDTLLDEQAPNRDAHGVATTKNQKYVWMTDRSANLVEVFNSETGAHVNTFDLVSQYSADPTPDLVAWSPDHKWIFTSTRGPNPLSGDPHSSTGSNPGLLVIRTKQGGKSGSVRGLVPISNLDANNVQRADGHAIRMRRK